MPDITSRQHSIVQAFKTAARGEGDNALLDGWHLLYEAANAGVELTAVAVTGSPSPTDASLIARLAHRCDVFTVTHAVMDAMSPVRTPAGVVALARRREYTLRALLTPAPPLVIVASDIQDPGNAGAIVRSAEAGGATGVLFTGASADPWSWKSLRAAMGSTFRLPVLRVPDVLQPLAEMRRAGVKLFATVPRGERLMHEVDLREGAALIVGAEGQGLDSSIVTTADERLSIPMREPVESLNVAVAVAVLVYEAQRQRKA